MHFDENITGVLEDKKLTPSAKILWLRLYDRYADGPFTCLYKELGKELDQKSWTIQATMRLIMKRGAIKVDRNYDSEGRTASTFRLLDPVKWRKIK